MPSLRLQTTAPSPLRSYAYRFVAHTHTFCGVHKGQRWKRYDKAGQEDTGAAVATFWAALNLLPMSETSLYFWLVYSKRATWYPTADEHLFRFFAARSQDELDFLGDDSMATLDVEEMEELYRHFLMDDMPEVRLVFSHRQQMQHHCLSCVYCTAAGRASDGRCCACDIITPHESFCPCPAHG